jgi:hypothetical protein
MSGNHGYDAGQLPRSVGVNPIDPRLGVRRSSEGQVELAGHVQILDKAAAPGQERGVFTASDGLSKWARHRALTEGIRPSKCDFLCRDMHQNKLQTGVARG